MLTISHTPYQFYHLHPHQQNQASDHLHQHRSKPSSSTQLNYTNTTNNSSSNSNLSGFDLTSNCYNFNFNFSKSAASLADLEHFNTFADGILPTDSMQTDHWGSIAQHTGRISHQRHPSLSSMDSASPASPYSQSISNPRIAVTDSVCDELSEIHAQDTSSQNGYYQLTKAPYPVYSGFSSQIPDMAYPITLHGPNDKSHRIDRNNLLPAPDLSATGPRSHQTSVASSIASDSPATPTISHQHETAESKRRKGRRSAHRRLGADDSPLPRLEGYGNMPKLDRTITDVYGDELYSPNFAITSTPPPQPQMATTTAPSSNDVFSQRLNAANSQHLNVAQSPSMKSQRTSSPFRTGSPFAAVGSDFGMPQQHGMHINSAQKMREQSKAQQDVAQIFQQHIRGNNEPETPTISPKDAMLEYHDADADSTFPLFPPTSGNFEMENLAKAMIPQAVNQQFLSSASNNGRFDYSMPSQVPTGIQVPQEYPFVARAPIHTNSPPKLSSSGSSCSPELDESTPTTPTRPADASAAGGTYTCTYHGCTLRFETPALLQKHKREGHRQGHTVPPRLQEVGMTSSLVNSQAGPHRCDRINPSTGKPCNTIFSRPYDLTRHEDTIHNARKQKVRCDVCTEEKTFSRADALTRHYRVCHPTMELPGKHRRRAH